MCRKKKGNILVAFLKNLLNFCVPSFISVHKQGKPMRYRFILIIVSIAALTCNAIARQQSDEAVQLERLHKEIAAFQKQLAENTSKGESVLQNLQELDYEISLHEKLLDELKRAERNLAKQINKNFEVIDNFDNELVSLQENFKKRAVNIYKYGRPNVIEFLINAGSVNQALSLRKYFQVVAKHDAMAIRDIVEKTRKVTLLNESLTNDLQKQQSLLHDAQKETKILYDRKKEREKLLSTIRKNNNQIQLAIAERKKAEETLLDVIANIGSSLPGTSTPNDFAGFARFSQTKGHLSLPTRGYIVSHMGIEQDSETKTKTLNHGVDILSTYGAEVRVVCDGRVAKIKWLPWYGQTVFVQHTEGFYTVYARLSEIVVDLNDVVSTGLVIGRVGREVTTSLAKLNFQIWKGSETLDPEDWLDTVDDFNGELKEKSKKHRVKN